MAEQKKQALPWKKWPQKGLKLPGVSKHHHYHYSDYFVVSDKEHGLKLAKTAKNTLTGEVQVHSIDNILLANVTDYFMLTPPGDAGVENDTLKTTDNGTQTNNE